MPEKQFKPNWEAIRTTKVPTPHHGLKRKREQANGLNGHLSNNKSPTNGDLEDRDTKSLQPPWPRQKHSNGVAQQHSSSDVKTVQNGHKRRSSAESLPRSSSMKSQTEQKPAAPPSLTEKRRALLKGRAQLPIAPHATDIRLSLRDERDVLLLVGETGSGKSTQVPQFLMGEPWMIGQVAITQPRRVAATSLAKRVAEEMGTTLGNQSPASKVGYSVRFDNSVAPACKVKFLTEGMLLQELLRDPWLKAYSVVVVDEVHERGMNVDLILGFLRRIIRDQGSDSKKARKGAGRLKVVVMSATAEMEALWRFFEDGYKEKHEKNLKEDEKQILLNGKGSDTKSLVNGTNGTNDTHGRIEKNQKNQKPLQDGYESESSWSGISSSSVSDSEANAKSPNPIPVTAEELRQHTINCQKLEKRAVDSQHISTHYIPGRQHPVEIFYAPKPCDDIVESALSTIFSIHYKEALPGDILVFLTGQDTVEALHQLVQEHAAALPRDVPAILSLPLYAALPQTAQSAIFSSTPRNTRKVIIATNVAETSVTIPGIVHVVDCGLAKVKEYRSTLSLDSLLVKPISKSSAIQRKGRAGRERPGKCWRLYTEREYLALEERAIPEILRTDVSSAILTMKARGVADIMTFPLLDPIPVDGMRSALFGLFRLGALGEDGGITDRGKRMARLPLSPKLSRVLIAASQSNEDDANDGSGVVRQVIDIISALEVEHIFLPMPSEEIKEQAETARRELLSREGDHLTMLATVRAFAREQTDRKRWCEDRHISHRAMRNVMDVRKQLRAQCMMQGLLPKTSVDPNKEDSDESTVTAQTEERILKAFLKGFAQNIARLMPDGSYKTVEGNQHITIHPGSTLFGRKVEAVLFHELVFTSKCYARGVSVVQMGWYAEAIEAT